MGTALTHPGLTPLVLFAKLAAPAKPTSAFENPMPSRISDPCQRLLMRWRTTVLDEQGRIAAGEFTGWGLHRKWPPMPLLAVCAIVRLSHAGARHLRRGSRAVGEGRKLRTFPPPGVSPGAASHRGR